MGQRYWVLGGEYRNCRFDEVVPGTEEISGPFPDAVRARTEWQRLILPAAALGYDGAAFVARLTRSSMLEVMRQDYIMTARAKGLRAAAVVLQHAFRNAMLPVLTLAGLQFGRLLGGAVVAEAVFARPGVGRLVIDAILFKDYLLVQGVVLFVALTYAIINLAVDLLYLWVDPRIRYT